MDIIDSPKPREVPVAREEVNLLLAEQGKMAALKVRRWSCPYGRKSELCLAGAWGQDGSSVTQRFLWFGASSPKAGWHLYCSWTTKCFGMLKEAAWEY